MTADKDAALDDFIARSREASIKVRALAEFIPELRDPDGPRVVMLGAVLDEMNAAMRGLTRAARRYSGTIQEHFGITDHQLENLPDADDER